MSREECAGSTTPALKLGGSPAQSSELFWLARVPLARDKNSMSTHISGTPGGTRTHNRLMAVHNNNDILMVHYEDLPDEDKDVIGKATEEFQSKCLLSYTKTRHNTIVQKFLLPRVLLHGQIDTAEAEDRRFFMEVVDKCS